MFQGIGWDVQNFYSTQVFQGIGWDAQTSETERDGNDRMGRTNLRKQGSVSGNVVADGEVVYDTSKFILVVSLADFCDAYDRAV